MTSISVVNFFGDCFEPPHVYHTMLCSFLSVWTTSFPPHLCCGGTVHNQSCLPQYTNMSYHHRLTSVSGASGDKAIRQWVLFLPPFSTVDTQSARMCQDDVLCSGAGVDIVGHVSPPGQSVTHDGGWQVITFLWPDLIPDTYKYNTVFSSSNSYCVKMSDCRNSFICWRPCTIMGSILPGGPRGEKSKIMKSVVVKMERPEGFLDDEF